MLAIGCYEAPDYSGTHFKCDSEHACPPGQACVNGLCNGGSGSGSDSGMNDGPPQAIGVHCGSALCTTAQKCCVDFVGGAATCIGLTAGCTGYAAKCDGREDCSGNLCCDIGSGTIECAASCATQAICRDNADCPAQASQCCPSANPFEPWGRCNIACP